MNTLKFQIPTLAYMNSKLRLFCLAMLALLASNPLQALGLGTIHVESIFGEPFVGSVEIFNAEGYDENSIVVRLASQEVHKELGINQAPYVDGLEIELQFNERGAAEVLVRGQGPVREPYIEFVLDMRWPEGRIVRDYTVLLNMPSTTAPLRQNVPVSAAPEPTKAKLAPIPHSSVHTLEWGDSLSQIAERLDGREVSVADAMETLRAHNANLLQSRGSSDLRVGDRLRIPAKEIFSLPDVPEQSVATQNGETAPLNRASASDGSADNRVSAQAGSTVGSPLANAETRLRALGYANLQLHANGETPNPVVASGAAANILERLIAEQSETDRSYGTTQIGRLAEGLNEVSSISRAYQQRLAALEDATRANAEALATLVEQNEQQQSSILAPVGLPSTADISDSVRSHSLENPNIANGTTPAAKPPGLGQALNWLIWLPVLLALVCGVWALKRRDKEAYADDQPFSENIPVEENGSNNPISKVQQIATHSDVENSDVAEEEASVAAEVAVDEDQVEADSETEIELPEPEETSSNVMPFYDESTSASEEPTASDAEILDGDLNSDLDSELDEELKLISIFEENLACETAVRTQMKMEEESVEVISRTDDDEDILDFNLGSLEAEEDLEFVLEDSEPGTSELLETPSIDDIAEQTQSDAPNVPETAIENSETSEPAAQATETPNYSGYAETAGFSHINPVEVVEIVNKKLQAAKNAGQETTLFYIEVDKFSALESELGLMRAEKLAANIASNIYDRIENPVTLKRFRQESFVLLLAGGQNQQNLQFGEELTKAIGSTPIEVSNETFFVTLTIGIVPVASGFSNSAEIIEMGKNVVEQYREENEGNGASLCELDPDKAHDEASIMRAGRKLLNDNAFVTVYQPVTALKGDPLEFYEARLKITEGQEDASFPEDLIERLGNTDLSTEIDCVTVNEALSELNDYLNSHVSTRVFIGISARSATDNFFKNWFEKTVFSEGIHPERIVFQLTEHSVSRHLNGLIEFRDFAHNMGARICISNLDFEHIPEDALARLHPDFVQLSPCLLYTSDAADE